MFFGLFSVFDRACLDQLHAALRACAGFVGDDISMRSHGAGKQFHGDILSGMDFGWVITGMSVMPHRGHLPGLDSWTSLCSGMGQV